MMVIHHSEDIYQHPMDGHLVSEGWSTSIHMMVTHNSLVEFDSSAAQLVLFLEVLFIFEGVLIFEVVF